MFCYADFIAYLGGTELNLGLVVGAGMYGGEVENDVNEMDVDAAVKMVRKHPDTIVGIKTAHFQPATWDAVHRAVAERIVRKIGFTRGDGGADANGHRNTNA